MRMPVALNWPVTLKVPEGIHTPLPCDWAALIQFWIAVVLSLDPVLAP